MPPMKSLTKLTNRIQQFRLTLGRLALALTWASTLAAVAQTPLIPEGSGWKYLDPGADLGTSWMAPAFNDAAWAPGLAQLGFGDGDEATVLAPGHVTYYFRRAFMVQEPTLITNLSAWLLYDDGAVVYLNGVEVYRANLPSGPITYTTLAPMTINDNAQSSFPVNPSLLTRGTNVIAVEVHQVNTVSSDLSFNFALTAVTSASDGYGVLGFSSSGYLASESNATVTIPVIRTSGNTGTVSVDYLVSGGTAREGEDFLGGRGTLTFNAGMTNAFFRVILINDTLVETGETVNLTLTNATGGARLGNARATLLILDDDRPPLPPPIVIQQQPASQTRRVGQAATFYVRAASETPLQYEWRFNGNALPGANQAELTLASVQPVHAGRYSVRIANASTQALSAEAVLTVVPAPAGPGSLDLTFDPTSSGEEIGFANGSGWVNAIAVQPDGACLVGGNFVGVNGEARYNLARLTSDGVVDPAFDCRAGPDHEVNTVVLQSNRWIVVGGQFTSIQGRRQPYLARLRPDGTLDETFSPVITGPRYPIVAGAAVQPDGKILCVGRFDTVNGVGRTNVMRLLPDGQVDLTFVPPAELGGDSGILGSIGLQADGGVLLFAWGRGLVRLDSTGALDSGFNVPLWLAGQPGSLAGLEMLPTGQIIVAGSFDTIGAAVRRNLARLNADGTVDLTFDARYEAHMVTLTSMAVQPDGRILVAGSFHQPTGGDISRIVRHNADGSPDGTYVPDSVDPMGRIIALTPLAAGGALVADRFSRELPLVRRSADGVFDQGFRPRFFNASMVRALALRQDGQVYVAGDSETLNGSETPPLVLLTANGTHQPGFELDPDVGLDVADLQLQPDGRLLVAGRHGLTDSLAPAALVRLDPNGSLDRTFQLARDQRVQEYGQQLALQPDGKILLASLARDGDRRISHGTVARLNADGSVDSTFQALELIPAYPPYLEFHALAVQPDGKILVAGRYHLGFISAAVRHHLVRLLPNGDWDSSFVVTLRGAPGGEDSRSVRAVRVQADGRILITGDFLEINGVPRPGVARLLADGSVDPTFNPPAGAFLGSAVLALQPDGKVLLAPYSQPGLVRLNADGAIDPAWISAVQYPDGFVRALEWQPDGRVLIAGIIRRVSDLPVNGIARLNNNAFVPVPPVVTLAPAAGPVDSNVTISGAHFDPNPTRNVVYFGGVRAVVIAVTPDALTVRVPSGAAFGPVTVTVNGYTTYSSLPFLPTYVGGAPDRPVTLAPPFNRFCGDGPHEVAFADFDVDGRPDVVVINAYDHTIALYHNELMAGDSFSGSSLPRNQMAAEATDLYNPFAMRVADIDGDGKLDLITANFGGGSVAVYRNVSTPGELEAASFAEPVVLPVGVPPILDVAVRDLNGDGRPDLVAANGGDNTLSVLQNVGVPGAIEFLPHVDFPNGVQPHGLAIADLDGDGRPDVVAANRSGGSVSVHPNVGAIGQPLTAASFAPQFEIPNLPGLISVVLGDLDGDGRIDLTVGSWDNNYVAVLRNVGSPGALTPASFAPPVRFAADGYVHGLALGDLNGDGRPDLAVVTEMPSHLSLFANRAAPGGFTTNSFAPRIDFGTGWNAAGVTVGDLNADGRPDVAVVNAYDDTVAFYQNVIPPPIGPGAPDVTFNGGVSGYGGILAMGLDSQQRLVIGGAFTEVNGVPRNQVARLFADGSLDFEFVPDGTLATFTRTLVVLPDDRVLVACDSFVVPEQERTGYGLARLNPDGSLDPTFDTGLEAGSEVYEVLAQPDGTLVIAGRLALPGRLSGFRVARLGLSGAWDPSFLVEFDSQPLALALEPDGRLLIGGCFQTANGQPRPGITRVYSDGTVDTTFRPMPDWRGCVFTLALQPDGRILMGGQFEVGVGADARMGLARLLPDGQLDPSLMAGLNFNHEVGALLVQPDGRILVGAQPLANTVLAPGLRRLHPDGTVDSTFDPGTGVRGEEPEVNALVMAPDGKLLVGGEFSSYNGWPAHCLVRVFTGVTAPASFVNRHLPSSYQPGSVLEVSLAATPSFGTSAYAVEDQPPAGWIVSGISHDGVWDRQTGRVKFGPFYDHAYRLLMYHVAPAANATAAGCFDGTASADGVNTPVAGARCTRPMITHPADTDSPMFSLSMAEVTGYGAAWRRGQSWPAPPVPIPMDYVTRAAALWRGGECYQLDPAAEAPPRWWVNCTIEMNPVLVPTGVNLAGAGPAERVLPNLYVPGEPLAVRITAAPPASVQAYAVEESLPAGWSASSISAGGEFDALRGQLRWGPFMDSTARALSYVAQPPPGASGPVVFTGAISLDGASVPVAGGEQVAEGARLKVNSAATSGQLSLVLGGRLGARFAVDVSDDLVQWNFWTTVTNSTGRLEIPLPILVDRPGRFFRARLID